MNSSDNQGMQNLDNEQFGKKNWNHLSKIEEEMKEESVLESQESPSLKIIAAEKHENNLISS